MTSDRHDCVIPVEDQVSFFLTHNRPTHRQVSIHPVPRMETEWLE